MLQFSSVLYTDLANSVCFGEGLVGNILELLWEVTWSPARGVARHNGERELGLDFLDLTATFFHGCFFAGVWAGPRGGDFLSSLHMRSVTHVASYMPAAAIIKVKSA